MTAPDAPPAGPGARAAGVLAVGDLMVDVLVELAAPIEPASDSPARISWQAGGSAANTAAWLAADGVPAGFAGRVGDDAPGRGAVAELTEAGVRTHITVDPRLPTGTCVVLVGPDGERAMLPDAGANASLGVGDLPALAGPGGSGYRHLHLSAYTLLRPATRPVAQAALGWARQAGLSTSVDAASAAPLRPVAGEVLAWLRGTDLVLVNLDEARALAAPAGGHDADDAPRCAALLAEALGAGSQVVIKLGAGGALWARAGQPAVHRPAAPVTVVDTTGAGDAFDAGFLHAWLDAASPADCLAAGHALGARAVSQVGARPR